MNRHFRLNTHREKRKLSKWSRPAIRFAVRMTPKRRSAVIRTFPDFDDTAFVLTRGLQKVGIRPILLVSRGAVSRDWVSEHGAVVQPALSLKGVVSYLRSRYVFFTHSLYLSPKPSSNQLSVNLWHGMPLKRIGYDLPDALVPNFDLTVATSSRFADIVARSFGVSTEQVWVGGLPRNDLLTEGEVAEVSASIPSPYVVWLPTYRSSVLGSTRDDGDGQDALPSPQELDLICSALMSKGILLIVKMHPMASLLETERFQHPNVRLIDESWLRLSGIHLYQLLAGAQALISDYSSVLVDYQISGRPTFVVATDADSYEKSRGLNFSYSELSSLGSIQTSYANLASSLRELVIGIESSARAESLFYSADRENATSRLLSHVMATKFPKKQPPNV
ncbi:CDP-glycerol glycerophosphotransferase family protein [Ilumatobacter sp.]|uniref:CDP-glycerol glycerophosphotransferase family protein n=1 Tax=Ilumatobacter sp. TaxID=1967498 RepID=UPI0037529F93